ncbi:hypothetical protein, partial [[Clostridium] symbiosum]|uniref:hypothetical protein n=1 Tax=Clostridium symbiosum TaxID=1512 RepID=UPI001A9BCC61
VFSMEGFGTVVTGTLLEGCCRLGQEMSQPPLFLKLSVSRQPCTAQVLPGGFSLKAVTCARSVQIIVISPVSQGRRSR